MDIVPAPAQDDMGTVLYIGHHETTSRTTGADDILRQSEDLGYDFVTTPITTSYFHGRVTRMVSEHLEQTDNQGPLPLISPLTPDDTALTPEATNPSRIAFASHWIDLGSQDPVISHVSRAVLNLEVAYAAFCGISNIVLYGPVEGSSVVQFARAIREALAVGPYLQLHILLPMTGELEMDYPDGGHLSEFVTASSQDEPHDDSVETDAFSTWKVWNTIRSLSEYSQKLSIGTKWSLPFTTLAPFSCHSTSTTTTNQLRYTTR